MNDLVATANRIAQEPSPCDGCANAARCQAEKLACQAFAIYVIKDGQLDTEKREPFRIIFDFLFNDDKENRRGPAPMAIIGGRKK